MKNAMFFSEMGRFFGQKTPNRYGFPFGSTDRMTGGNASPGSVDSIYNRSGSSL